MKRILVILLAFLSLGFIPFQDGFVINPYRYASGLLLDTYSGAAAAYSLRKLRTAYTGACVRVRRSSDNAESDIGFVGDTLDTDSLTSFVGANSAYVTTWYDQASSYDMTQSTAANQPRIVNAGVIDSSNSKPAMYFDRVNDFLGNSTLGSTFVGDDLPHSIFIVAEQTIASVSANTMFSVGKSTSNEGYWTVAWNHSTLYPYMGSRDPSATSGNLVDTVQWTSGQLNLTVISTGTFAYLYQNGVATNSGSVDIAAQTATMDRAAIGAFRRLADANYFGGYIQEEVLYNSDETSNVTGINANINNYYQP